MNTAIVILTGVLVFSLLPARADTFGSGANTFTIDFVTVGNPGNADDAGAGGGIYSSPSGGVPYVYRMGVYEISQDVTTKAKTLGLTNVTAGAWAASRPAADMTWYEAAAFVNWLNQQFYNNPSFEAYDLTWTGSSWSMSLWSSGQSWQAGGESLYRHKDAYYFLPNEDEWYKAAFHKKDGVTANYWDFSTGSNSVPDGIDSNGDPSYQAVFHDGYNQLQPNATTSAGSASSAYGTYGQGGNVVEWVENASDGLNDDPSEPRGGRGGHWGTTSHFLRSESRSAFVPIYSEGHVGFRVASVPEPSSAVLLLGAGLAVAGRRSRKARA